MNEANIVYGVCWFQPEQRERLLAISEDRDELESTYEEWRSSASKTIKEFDSEGQKIKKVKVEELLAWRHGNRIAVIGKSRSDYFSHVLAKRSSKP
ncbi:MAG: hypothetical protein HRU20_29365 [Pseudomonadales bacterium]|nr:hypothetical protein [Pseudomonadales bacterium]